MGRQLPGLSINEQKTGLERSRTTEYGTGCGGMRGDGINGMDELCGQERQDGKG